MSRITRLPIVLVAAAIALSGCAIQVNPPTGDDGIPQETIAPTAPPAEIADITGWFGEIDGYSSFDLSSGIPSQPIFLRERGSLDGSLLDGTRARAVNYERIDSPTDSLVRQGFTASAIFIAAPADEEGQARDLGALLEREAPAADGWVSSTVESRTIGENEFTLLDSTQQLDGLDPVHTRSWVAVIGAHLVTVTFDWAPAGGVASAVTPTYTEADVAAQVAVIEGMLAALV